MEQLERAATKLLESLDRTFLGVAMTDLPAEPDPDTRVRWQLRYRAALRRLREAGIETAADEAAGAGKYVALRARWDRYVHALAPAMAYCMLEIDPAGAPPEPAYRTQATPVRAVAREV